MRIQRETLEILFTVFYLAMLLWQIILLVVVLRKRRGQKQRSSLIRLMLLESGCIIFSFFLSKYFDSLPGYGFMPGFTWLYLWIISFAMIFVFLLMFLITAIAFIIKTRKPRKAQQPEEP